MSKRISRAEAVRQNREYAKSLKSSLSRSNFVVGNADRKGRYETTANRANKAVAAGGGEMSRPDPKAAAKLRQSNITLGREPSVFQSTAQSSFSIITDKDLKNARPARGEDIRASSLTIGSADTKVDMRSMSTSSYGSNIDTAKDRPEMVHKTQTNSHLTMGVHIQDWKTTGKLQAPQKGVEYTPNLTTKATMSRTNWSAGTDTIDYVSEAVSANQRANEVIQTQKAHVPARDNNISLGNDRNNYDTESKKSFAQTKPDIREMREHHEAIIAMKQKVRQSNVMLGGKSTGYATTSKDNLFDPQGDTSAYKTRFQIDQKKLYKTHWNTGTAGPEFGTTAGSTFFDTENDKKVRQACSNRSKPFTKFKTQNNIRLEETSEPRTFASETNARFPRHATEEYSRAQNSGRTNKHTQSHFSMGVDKSDMIPTSKYGVNEKALYENRYTKDKGMDLRSTNFSLGTDASSYDRVDASAYKFHDHAAYAAAANRPKVNNQKTNFKMGSDVTDYQTTSALATAYD